MRTLTKKDTNPRWLWKGRWMTYAELKIRVRAKQATNKPNTIDLRGHEQIASLKHALEYASILGYEMLIFGKDNNIHDVEPNLIVGEDNPLIQYTGN